MRVNEIFKRILYYISVPKCVYCNERLDYEDRGLCKSCIQKYNEHKKRNCSRCAKILSKCSCPSEYLFDHGVKKVCKVFRYSKQEGSMPSNYLIYSLKQDNREDVIELMASELASAISNSINLRKGKYIITNVPRRKSAILNYGFDHAEVLAKRISKLLGIKYIRILKSNARLAQKSVMGEARLRNANFDYVSKRDISLKGYTVILVDDIITTGASMSSCAMLIKGFSPTRVIGAALGIAYKDYKEF